MWEEAGEEVEPPLPLHDGKIDYDQRAKKEMAELAETAVRMAGHVAAPRALPASAAASRSAIATSLPPNSAVKHGHFSSSAAVSETLPVVERVQTPLRTPASTGRGFAAYSTPASLGTTRLLPISTDPRLRAIPSARAPTPLPPCPPPPPPPFVTLDGVRLTPSATLHSRKVPAPVPSTSESSSHAHFLPSASASSSFSEGANPLATTAAPAAPPPRQPLPAAAITAGAPAGQNALPPSRSRRISPPVPPPNRSDGDRAATPAAAADQLPFLSPWRDEHYERGMAGLRRFLDLVEASRSR
ncbi:hypothetical protein JCM3774_004548 [Rhodotorula dairenensis]